MTCTCHSSVKPEKSGLGKSESRISSTTTSNHSGSPVASTSRPIFEIRLSAAWDESEAAAPEAGEGLAHDVLEMPAVDASQHVDVRVADLGQRLLVDRGQRLHRQHPDQPADPLQLVLPALVRLRLDAGRRVEVAALDLRVVGQGEQRFGARRQRAAAGRDPIQLLEAFPQAGVGDRRQRLRKRRVRSGPRLLAPPDRGVLVRPATECRPRAGPRRAAGGFVRACRRRRRAAPPGASRSNASGAATRSRRAGDRAGTANPGDRGCGPAGAAGGAAGLPPPGPPSPGST